MKKYIMFTAIIVLGLSTYAHAAVSPGEAAPDFTLRDTQLKPVSLSDFSGKTVVLEWFNYDCPFVRKHYGSQNMQRLQKQYTDQGIIWLSINSSAPGKQGAYPADQMDQLKEQKRAHSTAVLLDPDGVVGRMYGAQTTPHMFIINNKGRLVYQGAIDSIASADPADIQRAENYVSLALSAIASGETVPVASTKSYGCSVKY